MSGFRYPNITGLSEQEQLRQLKSYLYQLVEQLNNTEALTVTTAQKPADSAVTAKDSGSAAAGFGALKSLIIKSADIVDAYSEQIEKRLEEIDEELFGSAATDYVRAAELEQEKTQAEERLLEIYEEIGV